MMRRGGGGRRPLHLRARYYRAQLEGSGISLRPGIDRLLAEAGQRGLRLAKPAPDIYYWVLERRELGPGACLALEDFANGLAANLGAGIVPVPSRYYYGLGEAGTPCRVLAGNAGEHGLVDVDLLCRWHHLGSIPASGGCS
ncbi:MAG TPA: hypothetical protein VED45_04480 [Steroidobacteraceae bacterium]|nr:hypothetical protein [Steroidobacteraceae bacterium]